MIKTIRITTDCITSKVLIMHLGTDKKNNLCKKAKILTFKCKKSSCVFLHFDFNIPQSQTVCLVVHMMLYNIIHKLQHYCKYKW